MWMAKLAANMVLNAFHPMFLPPFLCMFTTDASSTAYVTQVNRRGTERFIVQYMYRVNMHHLMLKRDKLLYLVTRGRLCFPFLSYRGHAVGQLVEAIPNRVIGIFNWPNLSCRTMALRATQPLTAPTISPGGKGDQCLGLKSLPFSRADCLEILRPVMCWNPQSLSRPV